MKDQEFDKTIVFEFGQSPRADYLYTTLGRALALSANFEFNCRVLNTAVDRSAEDLSFEDNRSIGRFFQTIIRVGLSESIKGFSTKLLPEPSPDAEEIRRNFNRARGARNYIIHQASLKLSNALNKPETEQRYLIRLRKELWHIWKANIQVRYLILRVVGESGVRGERPGDEEAAYWLSWLQSLPTNGG